MISRASALLVAMRDVIKNGREAVEAYSAFREALRDAAVKSGSVYRCPKCGEAVEFTIPQKDARA